MIIIVLFFYFLGRFVANPKNKLFYKQINNIKAKEYPTNIIKNYIGNIISIIGLTICSIFYFKITNIFCYISLAMLLIWAFLRHIADVTEKDLIVIVNRLIFGKIKSNNIFMKITFVGMISLTMSGFLCTKIIYPILSSELISSNITINEDERSLLDIIEEMEKDESSKSSEELLMEEIEKIID